MTIVAGSTQYLNAARLANKYGISAQAPTLLSQNTSAGSMLEAGRSALAIRGFGASPGARALNQQLLSRTSDVNQMFSLGLGTDSTVDGARQQIMALRARLADSQIAPDLRGTDVDETA